MKNKKITIKDLAKKLKVSVSTVSKALNDSHEISVLTKNRVRSIAKKYNYHPNFMAVGLHSKFTKTIGVVIPNILNYFFVNVLQGIEKETRLRGYKIITCLSNESYSIEEENINTLVQGSVDGIILSLSIGTQKIKNYDHIQRLLKNNTPVVLFDRVADKINCDKVVSDNYKGAYEATSFLIDSGCRKIALFTTHKDLSVVKLRNRGYADAIKKAKLKGYILNVLDKGSSEPLIRECIEAHELDAVFAVDELLAIKAIKVAKTLKIEIPNEFQVIGYADGELSKEYHPSLSSVKLHANEIGKTAAVRLIENLENKERVTQKKGETIVIDSTLVQRESTLDKVEQPRIKTHK